MSNKKFEEVVEAILVKYKTSLLRKMWEEAISFGTGASAITYWVRDSEDAVNIVWLSPSGIRDITWFPKSNQSSFNFLPLRSIVALEVRRGPDIAKLCGYPVKGNLIIRVFCVTNQGNLAWVPDTKKQERDLRAFAYRVFTAYVTAVGA